MTKAKPKPPADLIGNAQTLAPMALREYDAAAVIGVSVATLRTWRNSGTGPRYRRVSSHTVIYPVEEIRTWLLADLEGGAVVAHA